MSRAKAGTGSLLRQVVVALLIAAPLSGAAVAKDTLNKGPRVGERIPHSLKAADQNNQFQDFRSLARKRGLIILFTRSLDW